MIVYEYICVEEAGTKGPFASPRENSERAAGHAERDRRQVPRSRIPGGTRPEEAAKEAGTTEGAGTDRIRVRNREAEEQAAKGVGNGQ
jgi:hypothetical protein